MANVTVKTNIEQFRARNLARINALKRAGIKTHQDSARFMYLTARRLAPKKSGALINGIKIQRSTDKSTVISSVPNPFPYNMWVNQSSKALTEDRSYRTLKYPEGGKFKGVDGNWVTIAKGEKLVYGSSPSHWRWTGTARFWHFATLRTREYMNVEIVKNVEKALKVTI